MAEFYTPTKLSENISETPEGFLLCINVPIARTGWQEYGENETPLKAKDGKIQIYRDPLEVFRKETIQSFEGKDVTVKHPVDFVTPENWDYLSKGIAFNIRKSEEPDEDGEESLLADLLIKDSFTIKLVKNGLREVSCGYEAEYEQTGEGEGRQFNIVGNHIALVEQGRAGSTYAINDEKRKAMIVNKTIEKLKKTFGSKVVDEAMKEAEGKKEPAMDKGMYDELIKMVKDLGEKVDGLSHPKDEDKKEEEKPKDEDKKEEEKPKDEIEASKDEDKEEEKSKDADEDSEADKEILERVKKLEAALAKLLGANDEEKKEESKDEDKKEESKEKVGDSKTGLEKTKDAKSFDDFDNKSQVMTADKLNELNQAHWARK